MKEQDYILFEEYLSKNLSDDAVLSFKMRLKNEVEFKEAFNTYKDLSGFLEHKFENEEKTASFKNNLKNISETYFQKQETPKKVIRFKPWQYAMAASVAIFFGIYSYNLFSVPTYSDFASYENISLTVRGGNNEILSNAQNAFNAKNFTEAETYFTQLLISDDNNQELQLYMAISEIELNKFDEADIRLNKISQGDSAFKNSASWYLALSKLKQKDHKSCVEILKIIPEGADEYKDAQRLLKKLN